MALTLYCPKAARAKVLQIDTLDACGRPLTDSDDLKTAVVRSAGFVSFGMSPDIEAGDKLKVKNAAGEVVINDEDDPEVLGFNLTMKLSGVPMDILMATVGVRPILKPGDATKAIGGAYPTGKISRDPRAVHVWTKNTAASACTAGDVLPYIEWLCPGTNAWRPDGDLTFENKEVQFAAKGYAKSNPNFGVGYDVELRAASSNPTVTQLLDPTEWTDEDAITEALLWRGVDALPAPIDCALAVAVTPA